MIKIINPKLLTLQEEKSLNEEVEFYQNYKFSNETVVNKDFSYIEFNGCVFENIKFKDCKFIKTNYVDCVFNNCDLSENVFYRVEINGCKLSGTDFGGSGFTNVKIYKSNGSYANFSYSKLKSTLIEN